jgi:hypothetical protein
VGDYDGDGKPDLVVQNNITQRISLLTVVNMKITASKPISPGLEAGWKMVGPK